MSSSGAAQGCHASERLCSVAFEAPSRSRCPDVRAIRPGPRGGQFEHFSPSAKFCPEPCLPMLSTSASSGRCWSFWALPVAGSAVEGAANRTIPGWVAAIPLGTARASQPTAASWLAVAWAIVPHAAAGRRRFRFLSFSSPYTRVEGKQQGYGSFQAAGSVRLSHVVARLGSLPCVCLSCCKCSHVLSYERVLSKAATA